MWWRNAGKCSVELLVIAANRHREVLQLHRTHLGVRFGAVGLKCGRFACDCDRLLDTSDLEGNVGPCNVVQSDGNITPLMSLESGHRHLQSVVAGLKIDELVRTGGIRGDRKSTRLNSSHVS